MKKGLLAKWGFLLAIGLIFVTGQAMGAGFLCNGSVEGTIVEEVSDEDSRYIVVAPDDGSDVLTFKGIPVEYLELLLGFTLEEAQVYIEYHECPDKKVLKACYIHIENCGLANCDFNLPVRHGHGNRIPPGPKNGAGNGKGGP